MTSLHRRDGARLRLFLNKSAARDASWIDDKDNAFQRFDGNRQWWCPSSMEALLKFMSSFGFTRLIFAYTLVNTVKAEICVRKLRSCSSMALNEDKHSASSSELRSDWQLDGSACRQPSVGATCVSRLQGKHFISGRWAEWQVEVLQNYRSTCIRAHWVLLSCSRFIALPVDSWLFLSDVDALAAQIISVLIVPATTWLQHGLIAQ